MNKLWYLLLLLSLWMKFYRVTNYVKPLRQYFLVALLVTLYVMTNSNFWSMKNSFHTLYDQSNETSMRSTQDCFHDWNFCFWSLYITIKKHNFIIIISSSSNRSSISRVVIKSRGRGFSPATTRVASGYFYWKIEEK